ncbi:MAG: helix-turn-helix domain-containing protein, partial [Bacteroidales bacterium]
YSYTKPNISPPFTEKNSTFAIEKNHYILIMNIILIVGFSQALILSFLIFLKKGKNLSDFFLGSLFIVFGITLFLGYAELYNRQNNYPYPALMNTSAPLILLHGPILWMYIKSLTSQRFRWKGIYLLHFIPFLFALILLWATNYSLPAKERILLETSEAFKNQISFPFLVALIALSTQGYFIWGIVMIHQYQKKIRTYFSNVSQIDLKWLKFLLISSVFFYAFNSGLYILDIFTHWFSYNTMQTLAYSFSSVFILVLGFYGHSQTDLFRSQPINVELSAPKRAEEPESLQNQTLTKRDQEFINHLLSFMQNKKPHLNPDLTLADLSRQTDVSMDYLSYILNKQIHKSFFDFVNHYRIKEFKTRCQHGLDHKYTIMGVAYESGFNSKATFNRVFKKQTGLTPGQYITKMKR